jgi:PadR family transcriptional regulator PadR
MGLLDWWIVRRTNMHARDGVIVLEALAKEPNFARYGREIELATGLRSGRVSPALWMLLRCGYLEAGFGQATNGSPPRRWYRITEEGLKVAAVGGGGKI